MAARLQRSWDENDNTEKVNEKDTEKHIDGKADDRIKCSSILKSKWKDSHKNKKNQQSI